MSAPAALILALAACFLLEGAWDEPGPRRDRSPGVLLARAAAYAAVVLFWFQFSWRPWLAGTSAVITVAVFVVVSRLKRRIIGEPIVFSDFALARQVLRHPQLYYVTSFTVLGGLAALTATVVAWYWLEPPVTPAGRWPALAAVVVPPLLLYGLLQAARLAPVRARLAAAAPVPDLARDTARWGLVLTLGIYALRWRDELAALAVRPPSEAAAPAGSTPGFVVVVQVESFLDPTRLGGRPLPALERLRARALMHGRLTVPSHGAYTMRSEYAVLTGHDEASLGFRRFDPYLSTIGPIADSLPRAARRRGLEAVFVHPFRRAFFGRDTVIPRLGFDRLVMEDEFAGAPHRGPYVSDEAVVARIVAEARGPRPALVFAVTMENHGPWGAGRLPGIDDPLAQYLDHVESAGRAIDALLDGLGPGPGLLCIFGDHPPSLPTCRPGFEATQTDYAVVAFGDPEPGRRVDLTAAELGRVLQDLVAGLRPARAAAA